MWMCGKTITICAKCGRFKEVLVMYLKINSYLGRIFEFRRSFGVAAVIHNRRFIHCNWARFLTLVVLTGLNTSSLHQAKGAPLMEEPFGYSAGSSLGTNSPWTGSASASIGVLEGNLSLAALRSIVPPGNMVQITGGVSASACRYFSSTPVASGNVYCSFLVDCSMLPTNSQLTACLVEAGVTTPNASSDPLDLYVRPVGGGYGFSIRTMGSRSASAGRSLTAGTVHLVVLKYAFGTVGQASLFIDPATGGQEPATPDATISSGGGDDDGGDDDGGGGTVAANLEGFFFQSSGSIGQGVLSFDTLRIGTTWEDVTPLVLPLSLNGPQDEAICLESPAVFTVVASGMPPYFYSWRTNGVAIPDATNSVYQLPSPVLADALNGYDVVVQDGFGTVTSRVATLSFSTTPPFIVTPPADQLITPRSPDGVFTVTAGGDAPLTYQWRANGVAIFGATNESYTIPNPTSATPAITYDVVVANPCGTATSSPPVSLLFPHVFYAAYDAGPGFFSGENLLLTNSGNLTLQAWSSASLSNPVTNWNFEGGLQEQPLNDGSGNSLYSINVTPAASPTYYIFGRSVSWPYLTPIPVLAVTTDINGFYVLISASMVISTDGILTPPGAPLLAERNLAGGLDLSCVGVPENTYLLQSCTNLQPPVQWITVQTNVPGADGVIRFAETNTPLPSRFYRLVAP
jgi:hypothetical protein